MINFFPDTTKTKTIPAIFNKSYDEKFINDFLAYILNHGYNGIDYNFDTYD